MVQFIEPILNRERPGPYECECTPSREGAKAHWTRWLSSTSLELPHSFFLFLRDPWFTRTVIRQGGWALRNAVSLAGGCVWCGIVVVQRLKSERTVMTQRRNRLNDQYDNTQKEMRELAVSVQHMQHDTTRLNALIAKNTELQQMLSNDNFLLEMKVSARVCVCM